MPELSSNSIIILFIVLLAAVIIFMLGKKNIFVAKFIIRGVICCLLFYIINMVFKQFDMDNIVSINAYTFLTTAFLGIPGFVMLLIIGFLL